MSKTRFSADDRANVYGVIRDVIGRLERDDQRLASSSLAATPDGYPTNSMPGPGQPGSVSNRVLHTVDARVDGTDHASECFGHLVDAYHALIKADLARTRALPPPSKQKASGPDWCRSCARAQVMSPVMPEVVARRKYGVLAATAGLCEWCWSWSAEHDALPPVGIVDRRSRGERITSKVIAEVAQADATKRRDVKQSKSKKRRRAS